jgi:hypothetical protein
MRKPINYDIDRDRGTIELYVNGLLLYSKGFTSREERKQEMLRIQRCMRGHTCYMQIRYYYRAKYSHAKSANLQLK